MKNQVYLLCFASFVLAGCWSVGPDYKAQEVSAPSSPLPDAGLPVTTNKVVKSSEQGRVIIATDEIAAWWNVFNDSDLSMLETAAFTNNLTLRAAVSRVRQARAQLAIARGRWEPTLDASGSYSRFRTSGNGKSGKRMTKGDFAGGFDANWEIDIFGGLRRGVEAAEAAWKAEIAGLDQAWVSLAAKVGVNYVDLRTVQERLQVARDNLRLQNETLDILASRMKAGIGDDLAVQQAKYNVETTRATIPGLLAQEESYLNALAVLTGQEPGALHQTLKGGKAMPPMQPRQLVGIDAELLRRRPDIRQAERSLAAQCARVGVATAELYPHFYLNGSIGLESLKAKDFFKSDSLYWNFGPAFTWSIFSGNTVRANIEIQDALYDAALANYQNTLLSAQEEIRDALSAYGQEFHRFEALTRAVAAA